MARRGVRQACRQRHPHVSLRGPLVGLTCTAGRIPVTFILVIIRYNVKVMASMTGRGSGEAGMNNRVVPCADLVDAMVIFVVWPWGVVCL